MRSVEQPRRFLMSDKWHTRTVTLQDGFTIRACVLESEMAGTDEEFLQRNPKVREIAERWAEEERERTDGA